MLSLSSNDLLYFVGTFCLALVTIFLCWALYEIARLVRQANHMVHETREKVGRLEKAVLGVGEKLGSASQYLGLIAAGGKEVISYLSEKKKKRKQQKENKLSDMVEEE